MNDDLSEILRDGLKELFQVQLGEFVTTRNRLARELASAGDRASSVRVKSLRRPTLSAWAINQVYWCSPGVFQSLMDAGEDLRSEQQRALSGGPSRIREAARDRQLRLRDVLDCCASALRQSGHAASPATLKAAQTSLEAVLALGPERTTEKPGWMTADIQSPGFDGLSDLPGAGTSAESARAAPPEDGLRQQERKSLERILQQLEAQLHREKEQVEIAAQRESRAKRRVLETLREIERLESRLESSGDRLRREQAEQAVAGNEVEEARRRVEFTQSRLEDTRKKLKSVVER